MSDNNTNTNITTGYNVNEVYGRIVVIKRTGQDSASFELMDDSYTFGRAADCDIRIQLASIAEQHCKISRNEHGQAVLVKLIEDGLLVNNLALKEESRVLEHNDIFTLTERSFRYEFTPEMLAKAQLASSHVTECVAGTIPLSTETPKKPSSLSASVFSISEVPSSPATPKTPVPAIRVASNGGSNGQSPRVVASPMTSNVVDNEITTSPKLSPKVFKLESEVLGSVSSFNIVGASSLGMNVISSTDGHAECDKENAMPVEQVTVEEKPASPASEAVAETVVESVIEPVTEPVVETETETVIDPAVQSVSESVVEPVVETEAALEAPAKTTEAEVVTETAEVVTEVSTEVSTETPAEVGETSEVAAENVCEPVEVPVEATTEDTEDFAMSKVSEVSENPETVDETAVVEPVVEATTEACEDVEMTEVTTETAVESAVTETTDVDITMETAEAVEPVQSRDVEMETTEYSNSIDASVSNVESTEVAAELVTESTEIVEPTAEAVEVIDSAMEYVEAVMEPSAENVQVSECATETVQPCNPVIENVETSEVVAQVASEPIAEFATESVEVAASETVVEVAEHVMETSEAVEIEIISCDAIEAIESSEVVESCEPSVEAEPVVENVGEEKVVEISVAEMASVDCALDSTEFSACAEPVDATVVECVAPVETVIPVMTEAAEATEPKSTELFVKAYETSSENNSPMEGVEVTGEVIEEQAENIEAPKVIENEAEVVESKEAETAEAEAAEAVNESTADTTASSSVDSNLESAPVIASETKDSEDMEKASVDPVAEEQTESHAEDNLEVSIDPLEDVVVEIRAGSHEIGSIEISSVDIPVSPSRRESEADELATSTPGPQRKSTRVHVTPKALESVKKQEAATSESSNKRVLRSTGGRQLRSRVSAEPASPKGRNQKRSAGSGDENVDPASLSLSVDSNNKKKTKTTESDNNTPLRRSTRSRVQK